LIFNPQFILTAGRKLLLFHPARKDPSMTESIFHQYTLLVDFLGKTLGPDYEVVLHDITCEPSKVIAIANSHISDRTVGSPTTNAALQMLAANSYKTNDFLYNYQVATEDGRILRASTMFIKDEDGSPIGLLGINFDDSRYKDFCKTLLSAIHPDTFLKGNPSLKLSQEEVPSQPDSLAEDFSMDISTLMEKSFDSVTASLGSPTERLTQQEKKEIVQKLQERGVFKLKGGISFVAKRLSCSPATVYRYLGELEN
jgi:predicted transcriptional regulator YheO